MVILCEISLVASIEISQQPKVPDMKSITDPRPSVVLVTSVEIDPIICYILLTKYCLIQFPEDQIMYSL